MIIYELTNAIRTGEWQSFIIQLCVRVFIVFCCLPVHEFAHALIATKLGDPTARLKGRLTLNPFAHLSLWGTLLMMVVGFGFAKPVPVNIRNFKNRKVGFALTSLAGPVSNLILAFLFCILTNITYRFGNPMSAVVGVTYSFFIMAAQINVMLALFNLIPIPPLDGSRLISLVLPDRIYYTMLRYERYFIIGIFLIMSIGIVGSALSSLVKTVTLLLLRLTGLPFGISY